MGIGALNYVAVRESYELRAIADMEDTHLYI